MASPSVNVRIAEVLGTFAARSPVSGPVAIGYSMRSRVDRSISFRRPCAFANDATMGALKDPTPEAFAHAKQQLAEFESAAPALRRAS